MRSKLIGLLLAVALVTMTITIVNNNTKQTEQKLNRQIETLEHKTREQQKLEVENLKKEIETIKQSKAAEKARIAAETAQKAARSSVTQRVVQTVVPTAQAATKPVSGSKADWMRAAGILEVHWGLVDLLVTRESGWNPSATNRSSGAYGLPQSLPGIKMADPSKGGGADWATNPVTQLRWMSHYVHERYGGWAQAVAWWNNHHWY